MIPSSQAQEHLWRSGQGAPEVVEDWWPRILDAKYPFQILRRQSGDDEARAVLASAFLRWRVPPEACRNLRYPSARDDCSSWILLHQEFGRATSEIWPKEPAAPEADQKSSADLRCVALAQYPCPTWSELRCFDGSLGADKRPTRVRGSVATQLTALWKLSLTLRLRFAPCGVHSHQGLAVLLKVGHSQHLLHWNSARQNLVSQSSVKAKLIAHVGGVHDENDKEREEKTKHIDGGGGKSK